jgi:hypothetical protein
MSKILCYCPFKAIFIVKNKNKPAALGVIFVNSALIGVNTALPWSSGGHIRPLAVQLHSIQLPGLRKIVATMSELEIVMNNENVH